MRRPMRGLSSRSWLVACSRSARARPVSPRREPTARSTFPYVAQSEALCGGAASAMVLRYWGARGVDAEQFVAAAQRPRATASRPAPWSTRSSIGAGVRSPSPGTTAQRGSHHLSRARPVIALIAVAPADCTTSSSSQINDAGRRLSRSGRPAVSDDGRWPNSSARGRPLPAGRSSSCRASRPAAPATVTCRPTGADALPGVPARTLLQAAEAAAHRDFDDAEHLLERRAGRLSVRGRAAARVGWPALAAAALGRRGAAGARGGRTGPRRPPRVAECWARRSSCNATKLEALRAWNRGRRTAQRSRARRWPRANPPPGRHRSAWESRRATVLTASAIGARRRRLTELTGRPSASRVEVAPVGGGLAEVRRGRPRTSARCRPPDSRLARSGVRALATREATWRVSSPTGGGERLDLSARWWEARPAVGAALSVPLESRVIGGILRLDGGFARESFQATTPSDPSR